MIRQAESRTAHRSPKWVSYKLELKSRSLYGELFGALFATPTLLSLDFFLSEQSREEKADAHCFAELGEYFREHNLVGKAPSYSDGKGTHS